MSDTRSLARAHLCDALIRTGDQDRVAFREVYRLTSAKLFGICLRICRDRPGAEDVLNEVYIIIWRRAGAFDPVRASPITWLATIARNRAIDWRRAQGTRPNEPIETIAEMVDDAPLASEVAEQAEDAHRIGRCLDELEERQRGAIRAAFFDGFSYTELAARDGVPLGTMKSWMRRGLGRLRECLER